MASQREAGLDDAQVAQLRTTIADGRQARVRVSGSQFPVATTGRVVRVGDPTRDGPDFVVVQLKVGGVIDELGFSPSELAPVGRRRAAAGPGEPIARTSTRPSTRTTSGSRARASQASETDQAAAAPPGRDGPGKRTATRSAVATTTGSASPALATRTRAAAAATRRGAAVPSVTITIASAGASWSVSASRGARAIVKKAPAAPGVVTAIAALLNSREVEQAVAAVNDAALGEAETRAEKLRAELAEIEAVLVSHQPPR